jgi:dynein heavy chain
MKHIKNLVPLNSGKFSGQAVWVRSLIHRIEQMKEQIDRLTFVEDSIKKPALDKYDTYFSTFR